MARETQGLQVLLIVFVMLCVVLGVSLYLYVKKADEFSKAAVAALAREKEADAKREAVEEERKVLKNLIGLPDASTEEIQKRFAEDMHTYGNALKAAPESDKPIEPKPQYDASVLYYSRLLASMYKTVQDRSNELIKSRAEYNDLAQRFKDREAASAAAIATIKMGYGTLTSQVGTYTTEITGQMSTTEKEFRTNLDAIAKIKANAAEKTAEAERKKKEAQDAVQRKEDEIRKLQEERARAERPEMDVPSGEIVWVSLPNKTVWINRGRADALQRQTKFTVYSADSTTVAKAVKKGSVEVTNITGAHECEARIVEDKIADPIMPGDKVFTPLWSPGQQNHFALAGIMNLDGDGRNQLGVVRGLINQNGGAVDCELDEQGHKQGAITTETRIIVVGDAPDKSSQEVIKNNGEILSDAERNHLRKMTLADFKQLMGYQKSSSVEHFGGSAPTSGVSRASMAPKTPAPKAPEKPAPSTPDDAP